jgi:hypothetical protein
MKAKIVTASILIATGCKPLPVRCTDIGYVDPIALRKQISEEAATYLCPYVDVDPKLRNISNPALCKDIVHGMCDGFDCGNYQLSQCLRCADYNANQMKLMRGW